MNDQIAEQDQALASLAEVLAKLTARPKQFVIFYEDPENEQKIGITIFAEPYFLANIPRIVIEEMLGGQSDIEI